MNKINLTLFLLVFTVGSLIAQDEKEEKGFKKENLFTGGSVSLAFYNSTFLVGGSPVFGYSLGNHIDLGVVANYNYSSSRDVYAFDDKLRQSIYGGGAFTKLYPVRFLFLQAQFEHNIIKQKSYFPNGSLAYSAKEDVNSFLIGGGYTTGRYGKGGPPFFYLAVLFDVSNNINSPYTGSNGRTIPIIRGGIQVPLFQGHQSKYENQRGDGRKQPRNYGR